MKVTDRSIERIVSVLLRTGVVIAGSITMLGGIVFVWRHWNETVDYRTFHSQPRIDRIVPEIVSGAAHSRARSVIQLGVLLLIGTPLMRVVFSLFGFALERDYKYVVITSIVLVILLYSLISGAITN